MRDPAHCRVVIHTGLYREGDPAHDVVRRILGNDPALDFHRYFHWYNILHETGHAIVDFNCPHRPHPVDEEQLVNDFAVAYWRHYGGEEGLREVARIIREGLSRLDIPAPAGMNYQSFARQYWGTETLHNFNNYGWFQFSCVKAALEKPPVPLEDMLRRMGVACPAPQPAQACACYALDDALAGRVLSDGVNNLRAWGTALPQSVTLETSNDPNRHMCQTIEIQ